MHFIEASPLRVETVIVLGKCESETKSTDECYTSCGRLAGGEAGLSLPMLMLDGYDLLMLSIAVAVQRRPPPVEFNLVARLEKEEGGQKIIILFFSGDS